MEAGLTSSKGHHFFLRSALSPLISGNVSFTTFWAAVAMSHVSRILLASLRQRGAWVALLTRTITVTPICWKCLNAASISVTVFTLLSSDTETLIISSFNSSSCRSLMPSNSGNDRSSLNLSWSTVIVYCPSVNPSSCEGTPDPQSMQAMAIGAEFIWLWIDIAQPSWLW